MSRSLETLLATQELTPYLPMIYVAWADGELTEDELEAFQAQMTAHEWDDDTSSEILSSWLDPEAPPTPRELIGVLKAVRVHAEELDHHAKFSLAELGQKISESSTDADTQKALEDLERALGVVGHEITRSILEDPTETAMGVETWRELEPEATFDVARMKSLLDGRFGERKDMVRELLASHDTFTYRYELPKAEEREVVLDWLKILADHGLGRIAYPGVLDDADDLSDFLATFESLAYFDLSLVIKYGVQFGLFGGAIYFMGTEKHHQKYLKDTGEATLLGCYAMSELGHGSNVRDLGTTATYDSETGEFVIHTPDELSRKEWIGNAAAHGQMAAVYAQLEVDGERFGVHAFLVPIRDDEGHTMPGVFIDDNGHKLGLNGVDNGRIWFDQVRIPRDNLLDRYGTVTEEGVYSSPITSEGKRFFTMLGTLVGGRVSVGAAALSAAKSAVTIATRYGAMRRQFGPSGEKEIPILDFRTHQLKLMPLIAKGYAISFLTQYVQDRYLGKSKDDEREVEALAAGLKAYSSWNTTDTIQTCREACGGQGYLTVNRFASLKADTDIFTTFEGDNTVLLQLVAKGLLSEYGQQFQDLNFISTLRFIARTASSYLSELDPVTSRITDSAHLRDLTYHVSLMRHREGSLVSSGARRFKRRVDEGMDSFHAMIEVQDHLVAAAEAYIERVAIEQFVAAIERADDDLVAPLTQLAALYALTCIQEDLGWFMENSLIEAPKAKAIRTEVNELVEEVRQQAVHFTEAFGIPEQLLGAPIAKLPLVESAVDTHTN